MSATATMKRPAAQIAQSSRAFVQPTHIDRATVIDAPHMPLDTFSPAPGMRIYSRVPCLDLYPLTVDICSILDSLGFNLDAVKQNDRPIYLDMQVRLAQSITPLYALPVDLRITS